MNTGARKNTDRKRKPMTKTNRKADGESERERYGERKIEKERQ